jgi:cell wall-associated NlpC family hydrolase
MFQAMTRYSIIRSMVERSKVVAEARAWTGTPWRKAGAQKGVGSNCLGFIAGVTRECGLGALWALYEPYQGLAAPDAPRALLQALLGALRPVPVPSVRPADVLLFDFGGGMRHVGLVTDPGFMVHCHQTKGGVVEVRCLWKPRRAFSLPGVI